MGTLSRKDLIGETRKARIADTLSIAMTAQAIALVCVAIIAIKGAYDGTGMTIVMACTAFSCAVAGIAYTARAFVECNE